MNEKITINKNTKALDSRTDDVETLSFFCSPTPPEPERADQFTMFGSANIEGGGSFFQSRFPTQFLYSDKTADESKRLLEKIKDDLSMALSRWYVRSFPATLPMLIAVASASASAEWELDDEDL